jgi:trehalose 6-phosphate phosphatase
MSEGNEGPTRAEMAEALGPLLEDPEQTGVFSDFDGTLAPIVDDPETSRPLDGAVEALGAVARRVRRVGVISGRPASFLLQHLHGIPISLWGLYGLESVDQKEGEPEVVASPEAEEWREAVDDAAARLEREVGDQLSVERKGLTVVLHYRRSPELADLAESSAEAAAEERGLVVHPGRMSYELRPPITGDKGLVLEEAASDLGATCFFGDDVGDLDAFDALDRLAERGVATVRVGVKSREAPDELMERADLVVDGPQGVVAVLRLLAGD